MFLTPLILQPLSDRNWLVKAPLVFQSPSAGRLEVPAGFVCDLNSIPRLFWIIAPVTDWPEAGTLHDYLYAIQFPKAQADVVYREALLSLGMWAPRAWERYITLTLFGGPAYRSHSA